MQLTFTKSKFDVAEGQYLARFLGVDLLEPKPGEAPRLGQDGKPMAPGMAWRFEVAEGESAGKIADRVTGRVPGPKNICGRFLAAVSGQILKDGMTVDLGQFVGKLYRINVEEKATGNGTCVSDMNLTRAYDAEQAGGRTPAPPAAAAPPSGPPPRRTAAPAVKRYWAEVSPDADPVLLTEDEVQARVTVTGEMKISDSVCPEGQQHYAPITQAIPAASGWVPF